MFEILTADEMKKADLAAIAAGTPGILLIEQAAAALVSRITGNITPRPALFLCGPGNNGADGFAAAALLKKQGWPVRVACLVKKNALKGDAALAAGKWDGEVETLNSNLSPKDAGLVVDAVFGTGFGRALEPELVTFFDKVRAKKIPVVAVDVPSGMDATTGAVAEGTLKPVFTVTFCRKKPAHVLQPSRALCGKVYADVIGIPDDIVAAQGASLFENDPALWLRDFPLPDAASHKYTRGHAVVCGGAVRTGAACLAATAAQRIGAGLVSITSRQGTRDLYASFRASIMVDVWETPNDFKALLRDERKNAAIIGPGGGEDTRAMAEAALGFNKSLVLDADVFTAFKADPQALFAQLSPARHVLTPHEGEFERLFGALPGNKVERARLAAKTANCIILLKGSDTVIAAPDGTAIVNTNAPATLSTGGSGDVLAGFAGGLMAQKMPPFMAAAAACWLHAESARNHGLGLTAEDIISYLPQTLNALFTPSKDNP